MSIVTKVAFHLSRPTSGFLNGTPELSELVLARMVLFMDQSRSVLPHRSAKAREFEELWREKCAGTPWTFPFELCKTCSLRSARPDKWKVTKSAIRFHTIQFHVILRGDLRSGSRKFRKWVPGPPILDSRGGRRTTFLKTFISVFFLYNFCKILRKKKGGGGAWPFRPLPEIRLWI